MCASCWNLDFNVDTSTGTECAWLRSPILPKAFVLELLDFVLGANAPIFETSSIFEHALLSRVRFTVGPPMLRPVGFGPGLQNWKENENLQLAGSMSHRTEGLRTTEEWRLAQACHLLLAQLHNSLGSNALAPLLELM